MFGFIVSLICAICLSVLCVYASNIKLIIPHLRKRAVAGHCDDYRRNKGNRKIQQRYETPCLSRNAGSSKVHSWQVGMSGHA